MLLALPVKADMPEALSPEENQHIEHQHLVEVAAVQARSGSPRGKAIAAMLLDNHEFLGPGNSEALREDIQRLMREALRDGSGDPALLIWVAGHRSFAQGGERLAHFTRQAKETLGLVATDNAAAVIIAHGRYFDPDEEIAPNFAESLSQTTHYSTYQAELLRELYEVYLAAPIPNRLVEQARLEVPSITDDEATFQNAYFSSTTMSVGIVPYSTALLPCFQRKVGSVAYCPHLARLMVEQRDELMAAYLGVQLQYDMRERSGADECAMPEGWRHVPWVFDTGMSVSSELVAGGRFAEWLRAKRAIWTHPGTKEVDAEKRLLEEFGHSSTPPEGWLPRFAREEAENGVAEEP